MSTVVEFVLACITEEEALAKAASPPPWKFGNPDDSNIWADDARTPTLVTRHTWPQEAAHITRWDPAHVLAECEARRRIINLWSEEWDDWHGPGSGPVRTRMTDDQYQRVLDAERVLSLLALPYADHPDYREEWRP